LAIVVGSVLDGMRGMLAFRAVVAVLGGSQ
jgi:hypothetical protein